MTQILFPVGRMISGSVYKPVIETDNFNKPKLKDDGTPKTAFTFGVAIKKAGEQHWSQTPWGQLVLPIAAAAFPQQYQLPSFAWKIKDGDSNIPNKNGKMMRDMDGASGHWVVFFKQTWAPKLVTDKGTIQLTEPEAVVPGYYIEVLADVTPNTGPSPGLYMNPMAVNRVAYGERIATASVDTTSVGFGQSALPAGASLTPVGGGFTPGSAVQTAQPQWPPVGQAPAQVQQSPPANPAFLAIPVAPVAPPAPPVRQMTAKAAGMTYEQFIANKWTDELLRSHGYMV